MYKGRIGEEENMFWDNHVIREDLEEVYGREINWERLRNKTIFIRES